MRFHSTHARVYASILGLSVLMAASTRSQAQDVVSPDVPIDQGRHHQLHHGWGVFHAHPRDSQDVFVLLRPLVQPATPFPGRRPGREDLLADDRPRSPLGHALALIRGNCDTLTCFAVA